jgi:hypothetical protein
MRITSLLFIILITASSLIAEDRIPKKMEYLDFGYERNHVGIKGFNLLETSIDKDIETYFSTALYYEREITNEIGAGIAANLAVGLPALWDEDHTMADNLIIPSIYSKFYAVTNDNFMLNFGIYYSSIRGNIGGVGINNLTQLDFRVPFIYYPIEYDDDHLSVNVFANAGISYLFQSDRGIPYLEIGLGIDSWLRLSFDITSLLRDNSCIEQISSLSMKQ